MNTIILIFVIFSVLVTSFIIGVFAGLIAKLIEDTKWQ